MNKHVDLADTLIKYYFKRSNKHGYDISCNIFM